MTLPTKERLEELRALAAGEVACAPNPAKTCVTIPVMARDLVALLDAAIALRRVETYMADPALRESYEHVTRIAARVQWGDMAPSWYVEVEGTESPRQYGNGPDLLAALTAALDKAGAK